jgi:hypothetical protein
MQNKTCSTMSIALIYIGFIGATMLKRELKYTIHSSGARLVIIIAIRKMDILLSRYCTTQIRNHGVTGGMMRTRHIEISVTCGGIYMKGRLFLMWMHQCVSEGME